MHQAWILFLLSALLVYLAGTRLTSSARVIADETGLGGLWVGLIILPLSTSLPEMISSWRAISIGAPDLAAGNFLGSNLFNFFIIALIDLAQGRGSIFNSISRRHKVAVAAIALMSLLFVVGLLLPEFPGPISPVTPLIFLVYLAAARLLMEPGRRGDPSGRRHRGRLYRALATYLIASFLIVVAAVNLADSAETLAEVTGLGRTFMGSFLLAISTSLPEVVTTTTAARLGALDMAVGNVLGANLFNLALLLPLDLILLEGSFLKVLSPLHLITASMGIVLAALVYLGLARPSRVQLGDVGLNSVFIAAGYIAAMGILYLWGVK